MYEALEELGNGVCVLFDMTKHWTIPIDFKTVLLYVSILRLYSGDNYKQLLSFLAHLSTMLSRWAILIGLCLFIWF